MDDYRWNYHVPAFGSWDYGNDNNMSYTQCFESARQASAGLVRHGSYNSQDDDERDLYVAGDLYQNDVVTPTVIVVAHRRRKGEYHPNVKGTKKQQQQMQKQQEWRGFEYSSYDIKEPPSPLVSPPKFKTKAVDEDLYKIPPEYLRVKPKRKRGFGLFSSCLLPACA